MLPTSRQPLNAAPSAPQPLHSHLGAGSAGAHHQQQHGDGGPAAAPGTAAAAAQQLSMSAQAGGREGNLGAMHDFFKNAAAGSLENFMELLSDDLPVLQ